MQRELDVTQQWNWDWLDDCIPVFESPTIPRDPEASGRQQYSWLFASNTGTGVPSGGNPLGHLLEFQSITGANKDSWRNVYGLIWNQVKRKAQDRVCLRYIKRLCQKYESISQRGVIHPEQVVNLDAELRGHLVNLEGIPSFIKNQRGSQHENVVRYIYGKYFMWFGRKRFQIDLMKSTRIKEQNKDTYSKVMKTLLSRVKSLLETNVQNGERMGINQPQQSQKQESPYQELKYF